VDRKSEDNILEAADPALEWLCSTGSTLARIRMLTCSLGESVDRSFKALFYNSLIPLSRAHETMHLHCARSQ